MTEKTLTGNDVIIYTTISRVDPQDTAFVQDLLNQAKIASNNAQQAAAQAMTSEIDAGEANELAKTQASIAKGEADRSAIEANRSDNEADRAQTIADSISNVTGDIASLQQTVAGLDGDIASLQQTAADLDVAIETVKGSVNTVSNKVTAVETDVDQLVNPNLLINGDFSIKQRTTASSGVGLGVCGVDRWYINLEGGRWVHEDVVLPNGRKCKALGAQREGDGSFYAIVQTVEHGMDKVIGNDLTVSFWVKCNKTGNFIVALYNSTDNTGMTVDSIIGGNNDSSYTIKQSNSWEKVEITFKGIVSDIGHTQNAHFLIYPLSGLNPLCSAVGDKILMADVKAEIGSKATPFVPDDPSTNLAKCHRYYYRQDGNNSDLLVASIYNNVLAFTAYTLPQSMRVTPTVNFGTIANHNIYTNGASFPATNLISFSNSTNNKIFIEIHGTFTDVGGQAAHFRQQKEVWTFDAEI